MVDVPVELRQRYQEGRLVPFVGAGVSMSVQWEDNGQSRSGLSWTELVNEAARLLGFGNPNLLRVRGDDLQILEYYKLKNNDEVAELRNWFVRYMYPPDDSIRDARILSTLTQLDRCQLMYTTNYDDFLERAFRLSGRLAYSVAVEAHIAKHFISGSDPNFTEIVKFHGDLNNPSRMVLSESDYEKRLRFTDVEDQRLRSDLLGRALLFIGYSFRDWNVSYLFRMVNDSFGKLPESVDGRRGYIAVPDPSDFEYRLFRARNIDVIPIRSSHLTDDIVDLLLGLT